MKKISKYICILFLLFFTGTAFAVETFKIKNIVIDGLQNVKEKKVLSELSTKKGRLYVPTIAKEDLRTILSLDYFDNAELSVDTKTQTVKFTVVEKPYISKIIFKGNKQFSQGKLKSEATLKEKDFYNFVELEESKRKIITLYKDKGYADCQMEVYPTTDPNTNKMTITFLITENNKILIGDLYVENVKSFKNKKIKKLAKTKRKKVFKEETLKNDMNEIVKFYKNHGFMDFTIEDPVIEYNQDRTKMFITLKVNEGPKYKIGDIDFYGNAVISKKELQKHRSIIKKNEIFNQEKILEVLNLVYDDYSNRGYLHSYIAPDFIKNDIEQVQKELSTSKSEKEILLEEDIKEVEEQITSTEVILPENYIKRLEKKKQKLEKKLLKQQEKYEKEKIKIQKKLEEEQKINEQRAEQEETLQKEVDEIKQKIISAEDSSDSKKEIKKLNKRKKKLEKKLLKIRKKSGATSTVNVDFNIQENNIVYVGDIYIDGLTNTKDLTIRREVLLKPGDVFSSGKVRRSMEKIYNLGFIDGAEPNILPTNTPDIMNLGFAITEGKPGMITAGAGYSSVDKFVGSIQLQHMNLFGRAQRLNLLWEFGARRQNYQIDWTEPWFLGKKMSLGLSVYDIDRLRDYHYTSDAYRENRIGGSVTISPRISDKIALLFGYTYEYVRLYDIDSEELEEEILNDPDLSKDRTSSVRAQIVYDTRDYVFDPSKGVRYLYGVTLAGGPFGGNVNYVRNTVKASWFFPTFWKFVFSVNLNTGWIKSYGDSSDVPLYERYYVGGADTIRGYKYRTEVGPYNGGKFMAVANVEYKFPIVQEKRRTILQGAFFYDIGGTWTDVNKTNFSFGEDNEENDEYYLKSGVGFGIRFATPVFPLRLDWGYGLNHKRGEDLQQFYFTIGNIF